MLLYIEWREIEREARDVTQLKFILLNGNTLFGVCPCVCVCVCVCMPDMR